VQVAYQVNGGLDGSWPDTPSAPDWENGLVPAFEGYGCAAAPVCYSTAIDRFYQTVGLAGYSASYKTLRESSGFVQWGDLRTVVTASIKSDDFGAFGASYEISMGIRLGVVGLSIDQTCRYFPSLNENTFRTTVRLGSAQSDATVSATFLGTSLSLSDGELTKSYTTSDRTGEAFPITFTANRIGYVYRSRSGAFVPLYQNISIKLLGFFDQGLTNLYSPPAGDYQNNLPRT
jgi:hypothetical protein